MPTWRTPAPRWWLDISALGCRVGPSFAPGPGRLIPVWRAPAGDHTPLTVARAFAARRTYPRARPGPRAAARCPAAGRRSLQSPAPHRPLRAGTGGTRSAPKRAAGSGRGRPAPMTTSPAKGGPSGISTAPIARPRSVQPLAVLAPTHCSTEAERQAVEAFRIVPTDDPRL